MSQKHSNHEKHEINAFKFKRESTQNVTLLTAVDRKIINFPIQKTTYMARQPLVMTPNHRKFWEKDPDNICLTSHCVVTKPWPDVISQPNTGTWEYKPFMIHPWVGNKMNIKMKVLTALVLDKARAR